MAPAQQRVTCAARQATAADSSGYPPDQIDPQWALAFRTLTLMHDGAADAAVERGNDRDSALARLVLMRLQHDDGSNVA